MPALGPTGQVKQSREVRVEQPVPTAETTYEPPQIEVVVTAADLERESLYAGLGAYGPL